MSVFGAGELTGDELRDVPEHWPVRSTEDVYRGHAPFAVRTDTISLPDGVETFSRVVVEHPGAVVVLAVDDEDRVLVLRQYRHPAGLRFVELPAGLLDEPGEEPLVAARRELQEEAGLAAAEWEHLSTVHNSPGISDERVEIYLARGLSEADRGDFELVHEEGDMTVHWVPVRTLVDAVLARQVTEGPLAIAVLAHVVRSGSAG